MPYQFGEHFEGYDDVSFARQKKQEQRFRELYFLFKTAPDFETKLLAALDLDSLCDEMQLHDPGTDPANDDNEA